MKITDADDIDLERHKTCSEGGSYRHAAELQAFCFLKI